MRGLFELFTAIVTLPFSYEVTFDALEDRFYKYLQSIMEN